MLTEICAEVRNYFIRELHSGTYTISNGGIEPLDFLQEGQYFRVVGSVFNDGVWLYTAQGMANMKAETFNGAVWAMAVPPDFIALCDEIDDWVKNNASALNSPFASESFGGYSYTKASGASGNGGSNAYGWKNQFASRLNIYRRMSAL